MEDQIKVNIIMSTDNINPIYFLRKRMKYSHVLKGLNISASVTEEPNSTAKL